MTFCPTRSLDTKYEKKSESRTEIMDSSKIFLDNQRDVIRLTRAALEG